MQQQEGSAPVRCYSTTERCFHVHAAAVLLLLVLLLLLLLFLLPLLPCLTLRPEDQRRYRERPARKPSVSSHSDLSEQNRRHYHGLFNCFYSSLSAAPPSLSPTQRLPNNVNHSGNYVVTCLRRCAAVLPERCSCCFPLRRILTASPFLPGDLISSVPLDAPRIEKLLQKAFLLLVETLLLPSLEAADAVKR